MRLFTVTCDGRPAAVLRANDPSDAIACTLDLAQERNLLGLCAGPRRFEAREPTAAERLHWTSQKVEHLLLHAPIAA